MIALIENVRDAIRWFRGADLPPPPTPEPEAEPVRAWLREQEAASWESVQQRRDWLERKLVYRTGVDQ